MADPRMVRHLKILRDAADTGVVRTQKFFAIGDAADVDGAEVLPLLSFVDDNLSRYVVSNAPSTSWGRATNGPPFVLSLPNRQVHNRDAIFLLSGTGEDRDEPQPNGTGRMHFVHLGSSEKLWSKPTARVYLYRLESVQAKAVRSPPRTDGTKDRLDPTD